MKRFVEGEVRTQGVLLREFLDDYVAEDNPVRVIDAFVDELDLQGLGFEGVVPEATGRPAYHPTHDAEDLRLRLHQPDPVESAFGARNWAQRRDDVADGPADAGLQDDRGLS